MGWANLDEVEFPIRSAQDIRMSKDLLKYYNIQLFGNEITDQEWVHNHFWEDITAD